MEPYRNTAYAPRDGPPSIEEAKRTARFATTTPAGHEKTFSRIRVILRFFSLAASATIVGLLLHVILVHGETRNIQEPNTTGTAFFDVWPPNLILRPALLLLGVAGVATFLDLILLLASASKAIRRFTTVGNVFGLVVSFIGFALFLAATVYFKVWDTTKTNYDLLSWTCTHQDYDYVDINFGPLCTEMRASWYGAIVVSAVELISIIITIIGIFAYRSLKYSKI